jgi:hypothetical protein
MAMKLSGPRAFRSVMMMVVTVVVAPFFAAIDATRGRSKPSSSPGCSNSLLESSDVVGARIDVVGVQSRSLESLDEYAESWS